MTWASNGSSALLHQSADRVPGSDRARLKRLAYLRDTGVNGYTDAAPTQARIRSLHSRGITFGAIGERAGIDIETVKMQYRGFRWPDRAPVTACFKRTERAILGARFTPADGYRFPTVGVRRRLQALQAAGFTLAVVRELTGKDIKQIHATMSGKSNWTFITAANAQLFIGAYSKLQCGRPEDWGVGAPKIALTKTRAGKNGYAPPTCWDDDTIDDPDAFPEWTGECGTTVGYRVHEREGIPFCGPCLSAAPESDLVFSGAKLKELRLARGLSQGALEKKIGFGKGQLHHWESGRNVPRKGPLAALMSELDVTFEDVSEEAKYDRLQ